MAAVIIVVAVIWIGGAILVARAAERKGYGFLGFLLLGLFLSPVTSGVILALDRSPTKPQTGDQRLATLQKMHAEGVLTDEEFLAQSAALGPGVETRPQEPPRA